METLFTPRQYVRGPYNKPLKERFEQYVYPEPNSGCWLWSGSIRGYGYGAIRVGSRIISAHRLSYQLFVGPILDGLHVLHTCDVPSCVNPSHLFLGTNQDNSDDKIKKNRQHNSKGEKNGNSKLTEDCVKQIRILIEKGILYREIAEKFNVHYSLIGYIKSKKIWKHL